jgi:thiamine kinase-like enzyme
MDLSPSAVQYLQTRFGAIQSIKELPSAQQRLFRVTLVSEHEASTQTVAGTLLDGTTTTAARHINVVVRQWQSGCRWWNFHQSTDVSALARSEVAGYRVARTCLPHLHIPHVLYFHSCDNTTTTTTAPHDENGDTPTTTIQTAHNHAHGTTHNDNASYPHHPNNSLDIWAVMEYLGPENDSADYWLKSMVPVRDEFGFSEPHPRWGRVPVDCAETYARTILRSVILPLHQHMNAIENYACIEGLSHVLGWTCGGIQYTDAVQECIQRIQLMRSVCDTASEGYPGPPSLDILHKSVTRLEQHVRITPVTAMRPVLCHMDCQPQNLLFAPTKTTQSVDCQQKESNKESDAFGSNGCTAGNDLQIMSVLDWEEAAYADPRFELILLGRKVCANRAQADRIWHEYSRAMQLDSIHGTDMLGPIVLWLWLESIVSLTTWHLQSLNLQGGGRSPWETQTDLRGKISRELERLASYEIETCGEI